MQVPLLQWPPGLECTGKLGRLIFAGISFAPPPLPSGYEGAEFYTRFVPYFCLHHVSPAVCACVRACVRECAAYCIVLVRLLKSALAKVGTNFLYAVPAVWPLGALIGG